MDQVAVEGKVKGTIIVQPIKFIRSKKEEGYPLVPDSLQHYLSERILPTSWHPETDHYELLKVSAALYAGPTRGKDPAVWEEIARITAPSLLDGTYRSLVRKGDPARTLASFTSLWGLQHDSGRVVVKQLGESSARIELHDYGLASDLMCASIRGSMVGLLEVAGARNVEMEHTQCRSHGDAVCAWEVRWDASESG